MDKNFFEFWRDFFVKAAESQKAMESMASLMGQGFTSFEQMTAFLQKSCNMEKMAGDNPDYLAMWKKAQEDFQKTLADYMGMMGVVPSNEHLSLVKKYEELKEKSALQEETIKHLRMLLSQEKKIEEHDNVANEVQSLIQQQTQQFQKMMESFGQVLKMEPKPNPEEAPPAEKKKKS